MPLSEENILCITFEIGFIKERCANISLQDISGTDNKKELCERNV